MKERRKLFLYGGLFAAGLILFSLGMIYRSATPYAYIIFIFAFLLMESKFLYEFGHQLFHHKKVSEEILVIGASAITIALGDYAESLSLVVMFLIGEFIIHLIEENNTPPEEEHHCHCTTHEHNAEQSKGILAFLKYYLLAVAAGIAAVLILSLFFNLLNYEDMWQTIAVLLLIACPCTLFISTPLCKYYAIKVMKKHGIYLTRLSDLDVIANAKRQELAAESLSDTQDPALCYRIARKYRGKVIQNIAVIIAAKILFMVLSLFFHNTIFAVSADLVIALILFLNAFLLTKAHF